MILGEIISETIGVAKQESTSISFSYFPVNGIELVCCFNLFVRVDVRKYKKRHFQFCFDVAVKTITLTGIERNLQITDFPDSRRNHYGESVKAIA